MNQLPPSPPTNPITDLHKERRVENITATHNMLNTIIAAVPAFVTIHDNNNYVAISGRCLSGFLGAYYEAGVRCVEAVIDVAGQRLVAEAKVYRRFDRRSGRMYYWLYLLRLAQSLLRNILRRYCGDAPRNAKRPLPITIPAVLPKPK
jgi:hypothetical protein